MALGGVDWANLSVGVAAIVGLVYVVRSMRGMMRDNSDSAERRDDKRASAEERRDGILRDTAVVLGVMSERLDTLHDDNIQTRATLKEADKGTTRKVEEQGGEVSPNEPGE